MTVGIRHACCETFGAMFEDRAAVFREGPAGSITETLLAITRSSVSGSQEITKMVLEHHKILGRL